MLYQFDCTSLKHAKAALLLYALYRSRDAKSSLNGMETWERFGSYIRGACLKSTTTAEFVQNFCRKAKIESIRPCYLWTEYTVEMPDTGELILSDNVQHFQIEIFEDNTLLTLIAAETLYLIMLVRERIQREKIHKSEVKDDENED